MNDGATMPMGRGMINARLMRSAGKHGAPRITTGTPPGPHRGPPRHQFWGRWRRTRITPGHYRGPSGDHPGSLEGPKEEDVDPLHAHGTNTEHDVSVGRSHEVLSFHPQPVAAAYRGHHGNGGGCGGRLPPVLRPCPRPGAVPLPLLGRALGSHLAGARGHPPHPRASTAATPRPPSRHLHNDSPPASSHTTPPTRKASCPSRDRTRQYDQRCTILLF